MIPPVIRRSTGGTGNLWHEFLFANDPADVCMFLMNNPWDEFRSEVGMRCSNVNLGYGKDVTIQELDELIKQVEGFEGELEFDPLSPDSNPQKQFYSELIKSIGLLQKTRLEDVLWVSSSEFVERGRLQ